MADGAPDFDLDAFLGWEEPVQPAMAIGEPPDAEPDVPEAIDPAMVGRTGLRLGTGLGPGTGWRKELSGLQPVKKKEKKRFSKENQSFGSAVKTFQHSGKGQSQKIRLPKA